MSMNETMNVAMNREDDPAALKILNWIVLGITVLVLAYFAASLPSNRKVVEQTLMDFKVDASTKTKVILAIPAGAFPIIAIVLFGVVALVHGFVKNRAVATCVHALISVVCCIAIMLIHDAMDEPIIELLRVVSSH